MSWSPAETWLFIAFLVAAFAFIVWCAVAASQQRRERPSRLAPMTPDEAHMADLRHLQDALDADYAPTPVDPSGRVWKRGTSDFDRGGAA